MEVVVSEVGRAECGRVARWSRVLAVLGRVVGAGSGGDDEVVAGRREGGVTASESRHGGQVLRAAAYEAGGAVEGCFSAPGGLVEAPR